MLRCRTSFNKTSHFLQRISFESGHNFPRRGGKSPLLKTSIIQIESPSASFTTLSHLTKSEIRLKKSPGVAAMVVANDRSRRGASLVGAFVEHVIGAAPRAGADNAHGFSATLRSSQTLIACWLLCLLIPWSFVRAPIWLNAIHSLPRTKPISANSLLLNTHAISLLKIDKICRICYVISIFRLNRYYHAVYN